MMVPSRLTARRLKADLDEPRPFSNSTTTKASSSAIKTAAVGISRVRNGWIKQSASPKEIAMQTI